MHTNESVHVRLLYICACTCIQQDGKSGDVITIAPDAPRPASSRKGGLGQIRRTKVIIDVREFRSVYES